VSLLRGADLLRTGYLRLETAFSYPDGTSIEVFVAPPDRIPGLRLTDLGQTTAWLLNLQVKPWLSKKRRALVEDALSTYGVAQAGGELVLPIASEGALADGVIRLSQACLRVADLSFTRRSSLQSTFVEEVEEVLSDADLPYEANPEVPGRYGKPVPVDFAVPGGRTRSLVLTLASNNPSAAHTMSNEIFRRWHDLDLPSRPDQRVTLFDDRSAAYREEDLARLGEISDVVPFSDRAGVRLLLAA
jgi:hypothetical protein